MSSQSHCSPGRFCWAELATADLAAALDFYCPLFGWQTDASSGEGSPCRLLTSNGLRVGALVPLSADSSEFINAPAGWRSHIAVDDIDAILEQARELGASVQMAPKAVRGGSHVAYLQDPGGALFGLQQPSENTGTRLAQGVGAPCWRELHTWEIDTSLSFYSALFGWRHRVSNSVVGGRYRLLFDAAGNPFGGLLPSGESWGAHASPVTPHWAVYFRVGDCDALVAQAVALGGTLECPVMDLPRIGRFAALSDPQGASFWVKQFAA